MAHELRDLDLKPDSKRGADGKFFQSFGSIGDLIGQSLWKALFPFLEE